MKATVKIIKSGYFKWIGKNRCRAASNITLIHDGAKNILVDTGAPGEYKKIVAALKKEKLEAKDIDIVIITHPHADHIGNNFLFKNALFVDSLGEFEKDKFLLAKPERKLTENVRITKTPGHALEDISVIVRNTEKGTVAVIGDVFWKAGDNGLIQVESKKKLSQSRKKILKMADWIVPGHGKMFRNIKNHKNFYGGQR